MALEFAVRILSLPAILKHFLPLSSKNINSLKTIRKFAVIEKSIHFTCLLWLKILKINILT
jgi:hypothetical protein